MPRLLARLVLPLLALPFALVSLLAVGVPAAHADTTAPDWIGRINALRASKGLRPLTVDPTLSAFAQHWADHMAAAGVLSHNPNLAQSPGSWTKAGENVGVGADVDVLFNAFVASPHHYENLVDPAYTIVGIGTAVAPNGAIWTTHDFEARTAPAAAPRPSTTSTTKAAARVTPVTTPRPHAPVPPAHPTTTVTQPHPSSPPVAPVAAVPPPVAPVTTTTSGPPATPSLLKIDLTQPATPAGPAAPSAPRCGGHTCMKHHRGVLHRLSSEVSKVASMAFTVASAL